VKPADFGQYVTFDLIAAYVIRNLKVNLAQICRFCDLCTLEL